MSSQIIGFDKARADRETPSVDGWCQMYVERGFGVVGAYPNAFTASQVVPDDARRSMDSVSDAKGCQILLYFDGWFNGIRYGDVAVYEPSSNRLYSGANGSHKVWTYDEYVRWVGRTPIFWSEWLGKVKKVANIVKQPKPSPSGGRIPQIGTMRVTVDALNVRRSPSLKGLIVAVYKKGNTFNYDSYIDAEGYRWVSYIGYSGNRNYVARRKLDNSIIYGEAF